MLDRFMQKAIMMKLPDSKESLAINLTVWTQISHKCDRHDRISVGLTYTALLHSVVQQKWLLYVLCVFICSLCLTEFGILLVAVSCPQAHGAKFRVNPGNSLIIRQDHVGFFIAQGPNEVRRQVTDYDHVEDNDDDNENDDKYYEFVVAVMIHFVVVDVVLSSCINALVVIVLLIIIIVIIVVIIIFFVFVQPVLVVVLLRLFLSLFFCTHNASLSLCTV